MKTRRSCLQWRTRFDDLPCGGSGNSMMKCIASPLIMANVTARDTDVARELAC